MLFSTHLVCVVDLWNIDLITPCAYRNLVIVIAMGSDVYFTVGTLTFGTFWQHNTRRIGLHFLNSGGSWRVQSWYPWLSTPLEYFLALMGQHTTMPSLYIFIVIIERIKFHSISILWSSPLRNPKLLSSFPQNRHQTPYSYHRRYSWDSSSPAASIDASPPTSIHPWATDSDDGAAAALQ